MNDDQLRSAFAELRRAEGVRVPRFERPDSRGRLSSTALAFAVVALIVTAIIMIPRRPPAPAITTWKAPTDFLLQTPGRELLQSTPDLKGSRE
jgi:hypothetical protein